MTTNNHPITPPPELVWEWTSLANEEEGDEVWSSIATQAARWGADTELEACVTWMDEMELAGSGDIEVLRAARRPKPPSLKEKALAVIENSLICDHLSPQDEAIIRLALEALPE